MELTTEWAAAIGAICVIVMAVLVIIDNEFG